MPHCLSSLHAIHIFHKMNALLLFNTFLCFAVLLLPPSSAFSYRRLLDLVPPTPLILAYHNGPLLTSPSPLPLYLIWYGNFTPSQQSIITDFLSSLSPTLPSQPSSPSVADWWSITSAYKDASGHGVSNSFQIRRQVFDADYSLGKALKRNTILTLINTAVFHRSLPYNEHAIYLVLTADDVLVERFCMNSCGFHDFTAPSPHTHNRRLIYGWVGNPGKQCPEECAWPFAVSPFGPPNPALISPNADVGVDGMIINIATILAGVATNPYDTGFYQGDARVPMEAVSACRGIYGKGAYPGYPGDLLVDVKTGASFNSNGVNKREFLVPAMWDPKSLQCSSSS